MLSTKQTVLMTVVASCLIFVNFVEFSDSKGSTPFTTKIAPNVECEVKVGDIRAALHSFSSGEYEQIQPAREVLLRIARESSQCRTVIVQMLMLEMDRPELDFEKQPSNYYLWREGAELLGELKATEALDLLISHLHLNNGLHSASQVFQPAMRGVIPMGSAAIPKLSSALRESQNPQLRLAAAYCLTAIGGTTAMKTLTDVKQSESNFCVLQFINVSLDTFVYKSKSGRLRFDNDAPQADARKRMQWLLAFNCVEE